MNVSLVASSFICTAVRHLTFIFAIICIYNSSAEGIFILATSLQVYVEENISILLLFVRTSWSVRLIVSRIELEFLILSLQSNLNFALQ